jgi:hypothetical protein
LWAKLNNIHLTSVALAPLKFCAAARLLIFLPITKTSFIIFHQLHYKMFRTVKQKKATVFGGLFVYAVNER